MNPLDGEVECPTRPLDHHCMAIIALGTLGDILPLLILSYELMGITKISIRITFITNAAHKDIVDAYAAPFMTSIGDQNQFRVDYVQCSPLTLPSKLTKSDFYDMKSMDKICGKVALMSDLILVIANLFCLSGYLVAESRCVRCILIHPHRPPSKMPLNFKSMLKKRLPKFFRQLFTKSSRCRKKDVGRSIDEEHRVTSDSSCWQDYEEWLWPTLTSMYDSTRKVLNLESVLSSTYVIPRRPIVLLVQSPQFYPPPGYWPSDRYIVSGCITHDQLMSCSLPASGLAPNQNSLSPPLPFFYSFLPTIDDFTSRQHCNTVCVDFGSMTQLLVTQYNWSIFCSTLLNLAKLDFAFIINCHESFDAIRDSFITVSHYRGKRSASSSRAAAACSTDKAKSNRTSEIEGILFLGGHVDHSALFKKCVAVLHHGGAGTLGACLHAGVPQVVMPIIHDQHANADRLQYMHMAPESVPIAVLFPNKKREKAELTGLLGESYKMRDVASTAMNGNISLVEVEVEVEVTQVNTGAEEDAQVNVIAAAVALVGQRLHWSCTPAHRLRCGCFGRNLRSEQSENGLDNVRSVVMKELALEVEGRIMRDTAENVTKSCVAASRGERETISSDDEGEGEMEWQELGNSMRFATHHLIAPEETSFLYNEVFVQRAYLQNGIRLEEGDLVIDVGANIGFFAVFAELEFDVPDALRIIAVEPCSKNFKLLQKNMKLYAPTSHLVQAAISNVDFNTTDCSLRKRKKRVCPNKGCSNSCKGEGCKRRGEEDVQNKVVGVVGEEYGTEGKEGVNGRAVFVDVGEKEGKVDDEVKMNDKDKEDKKWGNEDEKPEHASMTYYPRMPGNSRMTHLVGDELLRSNTSFLMGSCQEVVVVKTLSNVIDDYENKNGYNECNEDDNEICDHCVNTGHSKADSGAYLNEERESKVKSNISLLKIDVEGSELCVLQSLEHRHWNRIDQVVIEVERPKECAKGFVRAPAVVDVTNCSTHSAVMKQRNCVEDDKVSPNDQHCNYFQVRDLLKLHGFSLFEDWGTLDGYDTGCLLLFGIKDKRNTLNSSI